MVKRPTPLTVVPRSRQFRGPAKAHDERFKMVGVRLPMDVYNKLVAEASANYRSAGSHGSFIVTEHFTKKDK